MRPLNARFNLAYPQLLEVAERVLRSIQAKGGRLRIDRNDLLHEAWIELLKEEDKRAKAQQSLLGDKSDESLRACLGAACSDVLIAQLRAQARQKRGGGIVHQPLHSQIKVDDTDYETLLVQEAIEAIEADEPDIAKLIKMRCYDGQSVEQCAKELGVSPRTVDRQWHFAKAMLVKHLSTHLA